MSRRRRKEITAVLDDPEMVSFELVKACRLRAAVYTLKPAATEGDDERIAVTYEVPVYGATWEEIMQLFDPNDIAWAVVNFQFTVEGGDRYEKLALITWAPDSMRRGSMLETARRKSAAVLLANHFRVPLTGEALFYIEANDKDDLMLEGLVAKVSRFIRQPVDEESVRAFAEGIPFS
eukprot:TRINITY_DN51739_c0_g1_i1.p1 TRINITY_DN51739_c0_g1~~TRINITY_DN51739_c0_g1_i1.p1  ORF type:complete len:178 (+),score=26.39 TRINITY_DN51739_c0_g1_i1:101-634(+)